jgi:protein required for attachment to host cells
MARDRNLLIVIADGEHARFVRPAGDNALLSRSAIDSPDMHKRSAELGNDHPGASFHSGSSVHHGLAPRHDPHALAKEKFAHSIAGQLNASSAGGGFDELAVVAPPHVLSEILGALDTATGTKVVGTLGKDLVKTPDDELWEHVRVWLPPTRRPKA